MKSANYLDKIIIHKKQEVERLIHETKVNPEHHLNQILNKGAEFGCYWRSEKTITNMWRD